jgi:hypothetical protein
MAATWSNADSSFSFLKSVLDQMKQTQKDINCDSKGSKAAKPS